MVNARNCPEKHHRPTEALYLLSFVTRPGCHDGSPRRVILSSRKSTANGHTEEYLLRYRRFGHHNNTDIVDSLTEYWTDWGGFREPIFEHQDLFPWDCTEARSPDEGQQTKCGSCQLPKHLWAIPFDSWSIAQLHLFRDRQFYAPGTRTDSYGDTAQLSDGEWAQNRLRKLEALQVLGTVASAMHRPSKFRDECFWNFEFKNVQLLKEIWGKTDRDGMFLAAQEGHPEIHHDRVKLRGIHRAQLMSHVYEHSKYHDCTLAEWADLHHEDQVASYKELRDYWVTRVDELIEKAGQKMWETSTSREAPTLHDAPINALRGATDLLEFDEPISDKHDGSQTVVGACGAPSSTCCCTSDTWGASIYLTQVNFDSISAGMASSHSDHSFLDSGGGSGS